MDIRIKPDGSIVAIYSEEIPLGELGEVGINRASHVEWGPGGWMADLSPVGGPILGPYGKRSAALEAEVAWLQENLIGANY